MGCKMVVISFSWTLHPKWVSVSLGHWSICTPNGVQNGGYLFLLDIAPQMGICFSWTLVNLHPKWGAKWWLSLSLGHCTPNGYLFLLDIGQFAPQMGCKMVVISFSWTLHPKWVSVS